MDKRAASLRGIIPKLVGGDCVLGDGRDRHVGDAGSG
jgi:hypothetical protein